MSEWRPSASLETLAERATLLQQLRSFFLRREVMEVETPLLSQGTVPDPGIEVFSVSSAAAAGAQRFLQTSPEFAMKRLLAAGAGDIFQITKAFRQGEFGRHHNPEFTLLEWYRVGWDHAALIREVAELISEVLHCDGWQVWPYRTLFMDVLGIDPTQEGAEVADWVHIAREQLGSIPENLDRDALLDLLMSHCIEPALRDCGLVFVTDFPASQAALARTMDVGGMTVAARFECYVGGQELANGYWEQTDAGALRKQLDAENGRRQMRGLAPRPLDERLLAAQRQGLPDCAGVAMGVDRLLALKLGADALAEAISFDWSRA
jgi:elongation factor P--(R)-beta-lysine ligase